MQLLQTTIDTLASAAEDSSYNRCDPKQFLKFKSIINAKPLVLKDSTGELLAGCILISNYPYNGYTYVNEIQAFKKGNGKMLISMLLAMYPKLWLIKRQRTSPALLSYYKSIPQLEYHPLKTSKGHVLDMFCTRACDTELIADVAC